MGAMKPLDPRLLRYARAARGVLVLGAALGLLRTLAVLTWTWCIAQAITVAVLPILQHEGGALGRVAEGAADPAQVPAYVLVGLIAIVVRSAAAWGMDIVAMRGAIRVKAQLREAALDALEQRSPLADGVRSDAELTTVLGRGLDALDGYFSSYLPQLILTAVATPPLVLAVLIADPTSGIIVLIVFPVIPIFMALIGFATQAVQDRQWSQLQRLSTSFMDAVSGLTTLKIYRREQRQSGRIERETEEYRSRTMKVLRVTFLSGFVLDLAGTFSIALVAVTIGTQLVAGGFPLALGLFVLLLLPEAFIPIRQVGAAFHASTEGLTASGEVFDIIESAARAEAKDESEDDTTRGELRIGEVSALRFDDVRLVRGGREIVGPISFGVDPGEVVAVVGPSGAGKSSLVAAALGFIKPDGGVITRPVTVSWTGQRPGLLQASVATNVSLGDADPDLHLVRRALTAAGLADLDINLGLGAAGSGVSGGQAQRLSIARALYRAWTRDAGALLLDEPSSALDARNEARIADAMRAEAAAGRAVLVVSHRPALIDAADRVVRIEAGIPA